MEQAHFISHEMLTHPALFSHPKAKKVAIIENNSHGIIQEVLKHTHIEEIWQIQNNACFSLDTHSTRVKHYQGTSTDWLNSIHPESFDIFIVPSTHHLIKQEDTHSFNACLKALRPEGILVQQCESPFDISLLLTIYRYLKEAGFNEIQLLQFPEPGYPAGWRSLWMAIKQGHFKHLSEKTIFNKSFATRYYNFDIHKASLVIPEFLRTELSLE